VGYDFTTIEPKWQKVWSTRGDFTTPSFTDLDMSKPKYYALDMFPYPSGSGLHVGHPEGYTATDIMSRLRRKQGYNVLHPMGWDAFGLPAEQYALQTGAHPRDTTSTNVGRFRSQLQRLGFSYDWGRELSTVDPGYYRWTQWIFARLYERGLAYQAEVPVNWCPALGTVLANEEVIDGLSERGNHPVERRPMRQWVLRITEYADRLLNDLDDLDWPENIKDMQRNWIGRSEGVEIDFIVDGVADSKPISVYTTRPETLAGVSYVCVAPEWEGLESIISEQYRDAVLSYVEAAKRKSDRERTGEGAEQNNKKTGVFTGTFARCSVTGRSVPIWVADYVLGGYGTGAVMAVPAHDARDFEFARAFDLPVEQVIQGGSGDDQAFLGDGAVYGWPADCGIDLNGVMASDAKKSLIEWLEQQQLGRKKVNYKLRDWLFSRQRYWGEPFPIVFTEDGEPHLVPDSQLPVVLPEVESYHPSGTGESPLANVEDWISTTEATSGKAARRETNTMPQWAGSCWYYLRFIDPENVGAPVDPELEKYWMPVQGMILGEVEYSVGVDKEGNKVTYGDRSSVDIMRVEAAEIEKVSGAGNNIVLKNNHSIKVGARAHKMSKSRGNVVNPDSVIAVYGADALRCYLMFMGPLEQVKPWQTNGVAGMARFLSRAWRLAIDPTTSTISGAVSDEEGTAEQMKILHRTIKKVSEETEALRFNTAIAALIEFVNAATKWEKRPRCVLEPFVSMLSIYAPHVAEELWEKLGNNERLVNVAWPIYEDKWEQKEEKMIIVQVNGKVRSRLNVPREEDEDDIVERVMKEAAVLRHIEGMTIRKRIYVQDKLVNLVVSKQ